MELRLLDAGVPEGYQATISAWFIKEPDIRHPATESFKPWTALQVGLLMFFIYRHSMREKVPAEDTTDNMSGAVTSREV